MSDSRQKGREPRCEDRGPTVSKAGAERAAWLSIGRRAV